MSAQQANAARSAVTTGAALVPDGEIGRASKLRKKTFVNTIRSTPGAALPRPADSLCRGMKTGRLIRTDKRLRLRRLVAVAVCLAGLSAGVEPAVAENSDRLDLRGGPGILAHGGWGAEWEDVGLTQVAATERHVEVSFARFNFDADGDWTGNTMATGVIVDGFTFKVTQPFAEVRVTAPVIVGRSCEYDVGFNLTGCTDTTFGPLDVTFHGYGPIDADRQVAVHHLDHERHVIIHDQDWQRYVSMTGTFEGAPLPPDAGGDMHWYRGIQLVDVCTGRHCSVGQQPGRI